MNSKNPQTLAIPFITFRQGKGFQLSSQAQQFLTSLPQDRELGIVSIVGKYRTGKSFFVNRVLLDQKKGGFQVGPTINPCTKGLWLWKKTVKSQSNKDMDVILIDTEGFGGMDQNANHDSRIFLFSLLLSSYFIYNSVGSIDENAINTLNLIINLAKDIQTKSNNSEDQKQFPSFLWIVRDFTLKLVDKSQSPITAKEYLQNALQFQKGTSDAIENKNKIRRLLKHFFHDRDCNTMVRPTQSEKDLQKLDKIDNSLLRPQFVAQVKSIREKVYSSVKTKKINGKALNGNLLVTLCKGYMQTINKGHLPNVQSAWFYVCRSEGLKAVNTAVRKLQQEVDSLLKNPMNGQDLQKCKEQVRQKVIQLFKTKAMNSEQSHPDILPKLEKKIEEQFQNLDKKNGQKWAQVFRDSAEQKIEKLRQKIYCDEYNDFSEFIREYEQLKLQFDAQTKQGDSVEKWRYFNELSENLYKLAGETITEKMNNNLILEKQMLEQKVALQEQEQKTYTQEISTEKEKLKKKAQQLQRENSKLKAIEESSSIRVSQYKSEYDNLYEKFRALQTANQKIESQLQKVTREQKKHSESENQANKSELFAIKSNIQKERALFEMEKQYMQQQVDRYKERCNNLEAQNRKIRTQNSKLISDFEELQIKYEQKSQQFEVVQQSNNSFSKKIEQLLIQNSKKNELVGDHNEWLLEKSYLENQVSFLKNTMSENKRLHDALLIAFQNSAVNEGNEDSTQLLEANKRMSAALEKAQEKARVLEDKYCRLKEIKRVIKKCSAMECSACNGLFPSASFARHLEQCQSHLLSSNRLKTIQDNNKQNLHITVHQMLDESRKKQYSQFVVQVTKGDEKWKIAKRYKEFSELQKLLINSFPSIKYPESCSFLYDFNSLASNRRNFKTDDKQKSLQQYLRDISKIFEIRESCIFKQFLSMNSQKGAIKIPKYEVQSNAELSQNRSKVNI